MSEPEAAGTPLPATQPEWLEVLERAREYMETVHQTSQLMFDDKPVAELSRKKVAQHLGQPRNALQISQFAHAVNPEFWEHLVLLQEAASTAGLTWGVVKENVLFVNKALDYAIDVLSGRRRPRSQAPRTRTPVVTRFVVQGPSTAAGRSQAGEG